MVLIHGTNILVDEFKADRPNRGAYIYFMTHFHYDYYKEIDKSWRNERIYCSYITKGILLSRFPFLKNVRSLDLDTTQTIFLDKNKTIYTDVTFFDANHCIGSVMILFQGYMGTILHTGRFRYSPKMLTELTLLYPPSKRNSQNTGCSIPIDELILDDTYCDPVFKFPKRNQAFKAIVKIIDKNPGKRFCVATDVVGKEELLVHLATHYKIKIVVDELKYHILNIARYYAENFTLDPQGGFIQAIRKSQIKEKLKAGAIVFVPTGWWNELFVELEPNCFAIGYSSHSNFEELSEFVNSIRPAKLTPQTRNQSSKVPLEKLEKTPLNRFQCLRNMKQNGMQSLALKCCDHLKLSSHYLNMLDLDILSAIQKELGLEEVHEFRIGKDKKISSIKRENVNGGKFEKKKGSNKFSEKKKIDKSTGNSENGEAVEEGTEMLDVVEIEEPEQENSGNFNDSGDEKLEDEEKEKQVFKKLLKKDKTILNDKAELTPEELEIVENIYLQPDDYLPFSDASEDIATLSDFQHDENDQNLPEENNSMEYDETGGEEILSKKDLKPHKIYSGIMTLTVTSKQKRETTELTEGFSMYSFEELKEFRIPKDMNFHDIVSYKEIEQYLPDSLEDRGWHQEKYYVVGWVESEKKGSGSLFVKLADHMKKHNVIRCYKIDEQSTVNFLHPDQIDRKINDNAVMVFIIISLNQIL